MPVFFLQNSDRKDLTMTNLWTTAAGRAATKILIYSLIRRRMKRFFKRKFVVQYDAWIQSGKTAFSFLNTLGDLNTYHDTEILNLYELLMTIGEAPETVADQDFHVNNLTGDDINGLGNTAHPFATVSRALAAIENTVINHRIRILLDTTVAGADNQYIDDVWYAPHDIRAGSVAVIGVGSALESFPVQTCSVYTALGSGGHKFTIAAPAWLANAWQGSFMSPTDGPAIGRGFPIQHNDVDALYCHRFSTFPGAADSFTGVKPTITVKLNKLSIKTRGPEIVSSAWAASRFAIINLNLDFSASPHAEGQFKCDGEQYLWLDFVTMKMKDYTSENVQIADAQINVYPPVDGTFEAISAAGIDKIGESAGPGFVIHRNTPSLGNNSMVYIDCAQIRRMTCTEIISGSQDSRCVLANCAYGGSKFYNRVYFDIAQCLNSNNGNYSDDAPTADLRLYQSYIEAGAEGVRCKNGHLIIWDLQCDPAIVGYALIAGPNLFVEIEDSCALFVATTGSIRFTAPNPDVAAAWPAAGAIVGDAIGGAGVHSSYVVRPG